MQQGVRHRHRGKDWGGRDRGARGRGFGPLPSITAVPTTKVGMGARRGISEDHPIIRFYMCKMTTQV